MKVSDHGSVSLTGRDIDAYAVMQCYVALRLQAETGLKVARGSLVAHARRTYGIQSRTALGAAQEMRSKLLASGLLVADAGLGRLIRPKGRR